MFLPRFNCIQRTLFAATGGARVGLQRQRVGLCSLPHGFFVGIADMTLHSYRLLATSGTNETNANANANAIESSEKGTTTPLEAASASENATTSPTTETAAATAEELLDTGFAAKLRANTTAKKQSGGNFGLFPWRSSPDLVDRLVPGTEEHYSKGLLLGGNLTSSNPRMDGFATACFFLRMPFWDLVFFREAAEQELADSMAWAFGAAVKEITNGGTTTTSSRNEEDENGKGVTPMVPLKDMMEEASLAKLFESASEFGRDSLEVKLVTKPIFPDSNKGNGMKESEGIHFGAPMDELLLDGPMIVSLFVFPFLAREQIASNSNSSNGNPHHLKKYSKLLDAITASNDDNDKQVAESSYSHSLDLSREIMDDFIEQGVSENTIICQVLVPCRETFWVKDTTTGQIVQGDAKEKTVVHLVRFEMVTKTHISEKQPNDPMYSRFFPFRHELGTWKITDIDDLCDGNLLL